MSQIERVDREEGIYLKEKRDELFDYLKGEVSERVIIAMRSVPREFFVLNLVKPDLRKFSYDRVALPICGYENISSISAPEVVAKMVDLLDPQPDDLVLEIGTATGYQAAVLSNLARQVVTVENLKDLAREAKGKLESLRRYNVEVVLADGSDSFTKPASFDRIILTAAMFPLPHERLFSLLKEGGLFVGPVAGVEGLLDLCKVVSVRRQADRYIHEKSLSGNYAFVPLQGREGWDANLRIAFPIAIRAFLDEIFKRYYGQPGVSFSFGKSSESADF